MTTRKSSYAYEESQRKYSSDLLSRAKTYIQAISRFTPDRQPEAHRQTAETEWRRQQDIQESIKGMSDVLIEVIKDLEKFGMYEEMSVSEFAEEVEVEPQDPCTRPRNMVQFIGCWSRWWKYGMRCCAEMQGYWRWTWGYSQGLGNRINDIVIDAQDQFDEIEDEQSVQDDRLDDLENATDIDLSGAVDGDVMVADVSNDQLVSVDVYGGNASMGSEQLKNLADGTAANDAINLSQLSTTVNLPVSALLEPRVRVIPSMSTAVTQIPMSDVTGSVAFKAVSSNYTLLPGDNVVFVDTTAGDIDINVPSGLNVGGKLYNIINVGVNTVNVRVL